VEAEEPARIWSRAERKREATRVALLFFFVVGKYAARAREVRNENTGHQEIAAPFIEQREAVAAGFVADG